MNIENVEPVRFHLVCFRPIRRFVSWTVRFPVHGSFPKQIPILVERVGTPDSNGPSSFFPLNCQLPLTYWCLVWNFREWSIITSNNHPSNPQQPIHFLLTKHQEVILPIELPFDRACPIFRHNHVKSRKFFHDPNPWGRHMAVLRWSRVAQVYSATPRTLCVLTNGILPSNWQLDPENDNFVHFFCRN